MDEDEGSATTSLLIVRAWVDRERHAVRARLTARADGTDTHTVAAAGSVDELVAAVRAWAEGLTHGAVAEEPQR